MTKLIRTIAKSILLVSYLLFPFQLLADDPKSQSIIIQSGKQRIDTQIRYVAEHLDDVLGFVVFIQGSGNMTYSDNGVGFDSFIEQIFFRQNYAVIYQNKRGSGKSSGSMRNGSIESRARDVSIVFNYYDNLLGDGLSPGGVIGHSQGGWVAQHLAGEDNEIDYFISLAGSLRTVEQQDLYRTQIDAQCQDKTDQQVQKAVKKRQRALDRMKFLGSFIPFFDLKFMANIMQFQPKPVLQSIQKPYLMYFAELDSMVSLEANMQALDDIFPQYIPGNFQIETIAQADHLFRLTDTVCFDYFRHGNYAEQLSQSLDEWLSTLVSG